MAILYGTQSNGETLPVLVDQFGNLLAKGIEGEPGTPGEPGEPGAPGAPGGAFPLPPDPYEGAFLGWLNNDLAWIGIPPVPIPEGVFGPITNWDPAGLLTVEGDIPQQVAKGVHVYQCNQDGTIYVDGWNQSQDWSSTVINTGSGVDGGPIEVAFNGTVGPGPVDERVAPLQGQSLTLPISGITTNSTVEVIGSFYGATDVLEINGVAVSTPNSGAPTTNTYTSTDVPSLANGVTSIKWHNRGSSVYLFLQGIYVNGKLLVDAGDYPTAPNLNFRIQSVSGQNLIGVANRTDNFTIDKYLRVPEQNVARWLYDGNLNKVITSTGIDISRLKET